jgi:hypothetical protein
MLYVLAKSLICLALDAELSLLRESDVCKLTKELDREKIKRKQLEVKLKKVKHDHDTTPKLRLCRVYYSYSGLIILISCDTSKH